VDIGGTLARPDRRMVLTLGPSRRRSEKALSCCWRQYGKTCAAFCEQCSAVAPCRFTARSLAPLPPRWYTARNDEAPSKAVAGAFAMMAAMTAEVAAGAETNILPHASFGSKIGPAHKAELFVCSSPFHHDGTTIRCGAQGRSNRLYAIDAPEMPEACRQGRRCTQGAPSLLVIHLRSLTAGKSVQCRQVDTDRYGRRGCSISPTGLICRARWRRMDLRLRARHAEVDLNYGRLFPIWTYPSAPSLPRKGDREVKRESHRRRSAWHARRKR